jgi:CBS domain-containing protein
MKDNIVTIESNKSIKDACNIYKDKKIGCLLVIEKDNVIGIVTERDIIERTLCEDKDAKTTTIKDIMTSHVQTIDANDRISYAVEVLKKNNIKKLPVLNKGELVGIVTVTDIALTRPNIKNFLSTE